VVRKPLRPHFDDDEETNAPSGLIVLANPIKTAFFNRQFPWREFLAIWFLWRFQIKTLSTGFA
jgi:hypothetical protein